MAESNAELPSAAFEVCVKYHRGDTRDVKPRCGIVVWEGRVLERSYPMSTYRFPLRGKIGVVRGLNDQLAVRLGVAKREQMQSKPRQNFVQDMEPLTEEEVRNLPVAHRYSA